MRDFEKGNSFAFDKKRDLKSVESGLAIDISDALRTGVVPGSSSPLDSNGINDPDNILGVARDRFDLIDADRAVRKLGKKANIQSSVASPPVSASNADSSSSE